MKISHQPRTATTPATWIVTLGRGEHWPSPPADGGHCEADYDAALVKAIRAPEGSTVSYHAPEAYTALRMKRVTEPEPEPAVMCDGCQEDFDGEDLTEIEGCHYCEECEDGVRRGLQHERDEAARDAYAEDAYKERQLEAAWEARHAGQDG